MTGLSQIAKLVLSLTIAVGASTVFLLAVSGAHANPGMHAAAAARSATSSAVQSAVQTVRDDAARKASVQPTANQKVRR